MVSGVCTVRESYYCISTGSALGGTNRLNDHAARMSVSSRKDVAGKRGGYTSLNLNQSYKGARPEGGRSYGKA